MKYIPLAVLFLLAHNAAAAVPNPAAVYAEKLGYTYKVVDEAGGQRGVVVVKPGVEFDAWDFYRGKVGSDYAYGAQFGYRTEHVKETVGSYTREYAVCVREEPSKQGDATVVTRIPMIELMEQNGEPLFQGFLIELPPLKIEPVDVAVANLPERFGPATDGETEADFPKGAPAEFDWRNVGGHSYIGDVRDQGSCGSCYSFGACAAAEGVYNVAMGLYDGNCADFSESYIAWCLSRLPAYSNHFYGCDGADYEYAELTALTVEGVCDEADFPYQETDPGSCTHWGDTTTVMDSWARISCGDIAAIKTAITNHGVVDAAVLVAGSFDSYSSGVYDDSNTACSAAPCYYTEVNHAIALVGWDDSPPEGGGGCWILRNSWSSAWGESGYMRIRYTAARVACEACYFTFDAGTHANDDEYQTDMNTTLNVPASGVLSNDASAGTITASVVSTVSHGSLSLYANGGFSYTPTTGYAGSDNFDYMASDGANADTATVRITVSAPSTNIFEEDFEDAFSSGAPPGWTKSYSSGSTDWARNAGDYDGGGAHGGSYNAWFFIANYTEPSTYLVTPAIDFGSYTMNTSLEFWHKMNGWYGDQDELRVYYKTSSGGSWNLLATYTADTASWTKRTISLPNPNSTYYIGFLGTAKYGYGVCIDDVVVTGEGLPPNTPPSVTLTNPVNGASACEGTNLALQASASDSDGTVTDVEFFNDSGSVGSDTGSPYAVLWTNVPVGSWNLYAIATDDDSATATSAVITVTVLADYDRDGDPNTTDPDDDNDDMPDDWELANGLNPTNAADATLDSDGDGINNVDEFVSGTAANSASDCFTAEGDRPGAAPSYVLQWETITGRVYTILRTTDLSNPSWSPVAGWENVPGSGDQIGYTNESPSGNAEYLRVRVQMDSP